MYLESFTDCSAGYSVALALKEIDLIYKSKDMGLLKKRKIESPLALIGGKRKRFCGESTNGSLSPHERRAPISKRVKFSLNGTDAIEISERYIELFRSELDKPNMWYSRNEREDTLVECGDVIESFKSEHADEITNFISVFDHCSQSPSHEASEFLESAQLGIPASARGVEWGWVPPHIESYRKDHVRDVLRVQEQIQGLKPAMRDCVISSRSLKSSRAGRVMARLLGECDARNQESP